MGACVLLQACVYCPLVEVGRWSGLVPLSLASVGGWGGFRDVVSCLACLPLLVSVLGWLRADWGLHEGCTELLVLAGRRLALIHGRAVKQAARGLGSVLLGCRAGGLLG